MSEATQTPTAAPAKPYRVGQLAVLRGSEIELKEALEKVQNAITAGITKETIEDLNNCTSAILSVADGIRELTYELEFFS